MWALHNSLGNLYEDQRSTIRVNETGSLYWKEHVKCVYTLPASRCLLNITAELLMRVAPNCFTDGFRIGVRRCDWLIIWDTLMTFVRVGCKLRRWAARTRDTANKGPRVHGMRINARNIGLGLLKLKVAFYMAVHPRNDDMWHCEHIALGMVWNLFRYLELRRRESRVWQTDGRTDGQTWSGNRL